MITLLCIAMPAKYYFGYIDVIWAVGMVHGLLWLAYMLLSLIVSHQQNWRVTFWTLAVLASIIPFACFFLDYKFKEELNLAKTA